MKKKRGERKETGERKKLKKQVKAEEKEEKKGNMRYRRFLGEDEQQHKGFFLLLTLDFLYIL